jgi:3-isopropylmalate/(R)-2-methylmalate dehydratase large subunit
MLAQAIRPGTNAMPRTLFDKIWGSHLVGQRADGRDLLYIDRHVLHELHAHHALPRWRSRAGRSIGPI